MTEVPFGLAMQTAQVDLGLLMAATALGAATSLLIRALRRRGNDG